MGMAAAELSDFVVLTSDNPRSEDPLDIMNDAMVGLRRFDTPHVAEPDRAKAIRRALEEAQPGDVVLLAGKARDLSGSEGPDDSFRRSGNGAAGVAISWVYEQGAGADER